MEDYFVSNKSKSEGMIDTSNISRPRIRRDDRDTHETTRGGGSRYQADLGATIDKELLPSNSMISNSLCQGDESHDDSATEISPTQARLSPQPLQQNSASTLFLEKGIIMCQCIHHILFPCDLF
jgi:hypothetical protein